MRAGVIALMIGLLACTGCKGSDSLYVGQSYLTQNSQMLLIERAQGTVVALSTRDGHELWRYQPGFAQLDYLDLSVRYLMVCPFAETADGHLLLRFDRELHSISLQDGKLSWKIDSYLFARGRSRCVAATPDSGVVVLRRNGLAVQKLDSKGKKVWWYQLSGLGAAVSPPQVVYPAGDTLIRTDSHVLSISPSGVLNWAVPLKKVSAPSAERR